MMVYEFFNSSSSMIVIVLIFVRKNLVDKYRTDSPHMHVVTGYEIVGNKWKFNKKLIRLL